MRAFGYSKRPLATSTFPASEGRSGCTATGALTALRAARHFARLRSGGRLGFGRSSRVRRPHLSQVFGCLQPAAMQCSGAGARHFADSLVCLTIRSSRRRFAARLNSGVRPGEKLSSVAGFGNCIALCVLAFLLGRLWSVARALRFSLRTRRFGQRGCAAAKRMG